VPGTGEVARFPVETLGTHKDGNIEHNATSTGSPTATPGNKNLTKQPHSTIEGVPLEVVLLMNVGRCEREAQFHPWEATMMLRCMAFHWAATKNPEWCRYLGSLVFLDLIHVTEWSDRH
jgi:hypothetical protein